MKPDKEKQPEKQTKASASKKVDGKVFDVSRPGKTAASPTSKPVILGHRPEAQEAQTSVSGIGDARPLLNRRKIQITPLGDLKTTEVEPAKPAEAVKVSEAQEPHAQPTQEETEGIGVAALDAVTGPPALTETKDEAKDSKPDLTPSKSETEEPAPAEPEKSAEGAKEEVKPEEAAEPEAKPASEEESAAKVEPELEEKELPAETSSMPEAEPITESEEKEEPAPEPKIEPLFDDSGAIVVSNHEHHHRYHGLKVFLLTLLILVLAAVALDVALDLGLLTIEGIPHTDFLTE